MKVLFSNQTQCLIEACQQTLQQPQKDLSKALLPISFCVPGFASEQWLIGQMSKKLRVFANAQFLFPNHIIDQLSDAFGIPSSRAFELNTLQWRIYHYLLLKPPRRLQSYLQSDQQHFRQWQLSQAIAQIFDQYQLQRPDWLEQWQQGKLLDLGEHEAWQSDLWQHLSQCNDLPYYKKAQQLAIRLRQPQKGDSDVVQQQLGGALHAFVLNPVNAFVLDVFSALSHHCPVSLYALNPSCELWTEAPREWYKPLDEVEAKELHWQPHHELLSLLGNQQGTFVDQLIELEAEQQDCYREPSTKTSLGMLQQHLLNDEPQTPSAQDSSLILLQTANPLEELQQARYQVEQFLAAHPQYGLNDCSIALADMTIYEPLIPAVFYDVYYYVGGSARFDGVTQSLLDLLGLWLKPDATLIDWQSWLNHPVVLQQSGLTASALNRLCQQLNKQGAIKPTQLPDALAQMLLGLMTHRLGHIEGLYTEPVGLSSYELLNAFNRYWRQLREWQSDLDDERSSEAWYHWLQRLIKHLLCDNERATHTKRLLNRWIEGLRRAELTQNVLSLATVHQSLMELNTPSVSGQYLSGQLRFAPLLMVNALPTPLQIIVGVGDQTLNLKSDTWRFDLQFHHRRAADRSRRDDVANQLLNGILSAQDKLVFIYSSSELTPLLLPIKALAYAATPFKLISAAEPSDAAVPTELPLAPSVCNKSSERLFLHTLIRFWQAPIRAYCQHHRIGSLWIDDSLAERALWQDQFKKVYYQAAVKALEITGSASEAQALLVAQFHFPDALLVEAYIHAAVRWQDRIAEAQPVFLKQPVSVGAVDYQLYGQAPHQQANTLYIPHYSSVSKPSAESQTEAWLWHVFGCATGRISQTQLVNVITAKSQQWTFIEPDTAQTMLQRLIEGYQQGLRQPITYPVGEVFGLDNQRIEAYTQHWLQYHAPLTPAQLATAKTWIVEPMTDYLA